MLAFFPAYLIMLIAGRRVAAALSRMSAPRLLAQEPAYAGYLPGGKNDRSGAQPANFDEVEIICAVSQLASPLPPELGLPSRHYECSKPDICTLTGEIGCACAIRVRVLFRRDSRPFARNGRAKRAVRPCPLRGEVKSLCVNFAGTRFSVNSPPKLPQSSDAAAPCI